MNLRRRSRRNTATTDTRWLLRAKRSIDTRSRWYIWANPLNLELCSSVTLHLRKCTATKTRSFILRRVPTTYIDWLLTRGQIVSIKTWSALWPLHHGCDFAFSATEVTKRLLPWNRLLTVSCSDSWLSAPRFPRFTLIRCVLSLKL